MSNENKGFSLEEILKKIQEGDMTLLIAAAIVMVIPVVILIFLTSSTPDKSKAQEKLRTLTQRKNVFNFGTKTDDGKKSGPKSGMPSSSSNWFGGTPEQRISDELQAVAKSFESKAHQIDVPIELVGEARDQYLAEKNYNLCMANAALEEGRLDEVEELVKKALEEAKENNFLKVYALGTLCALYERTGDKKKLEEAYKLYIDAVTKIPPEYGGMDLKRAVRDTYQGLLVIGKHATESEIFEALSKEPLVKSGNLPQNVNIREVYKDFPIKYD